MAANNWPGSNIYDPFQIDPPASQEPPVRMRQPLPGAANMGVDTSQPVGENSRMIDKIRQEMEEGFAEIREEIKGINGMVQQAGPQFRAIDVQSKARDKNSAVRLTKFQTATHWASKLEPLVSVRTGETIKGFPAAWRDIYSLTDNQAHQILSELGITMVGVGLLDKLKQIELCCGIVKLVT